MYIYAYNNNYVQIQIYTIKHCVVASLLLCNVADKKVPISIAYGGVPYAFCWHFLHLLHLRWLLSSCDQA